MTSGSIEECDPKPILEGADLDTHGRLGDTEATGRLREILRLGSHNEYV
jgi:hypothetical protein